MERRSSGRSRKPVDYKAFAGADSDGDDFIPEPKRAKEDTESADIRPVKPTISKPPPSSKPVSGRKPTSRGDVQYLDDEGLSDSEPATPEEESDDEFHLDGSPSEDSGSDFEPEPTSRKRKVTPVKKKPKGAVKKSPKAAAGRGRGGGRSSSGKGRSRKDPSLSPARITPREQQSRGGLQRLATKDNDKPTIRSTNTTTPLTANTSSSSIVDTGSSSLRFGMSRNVKVKPLHPKVHPPS